MGIVRSCARCSAGVSGSRLYCAPCADIRRIEAKHRQNEKRAMKASTIPDGVRYVGTKRGMLVVRKPIKRAADKAARAQEKPNAKGRHETA